MVTGPDCETLSFLMLEHVGGGALPDKEAPLLLLLLLLSHPSPEDPLEGLTPGPLESVLRVLGPLEYCVGPPREDWCFSEADEIPTLL